MRVWSRNACTCVSIEDKTARERESEMPCKTYGDDRAVDSVRPLIVPTVLAKKIGPIRMN